MIRPTCRSCRHFDGDTPPSDEGTCRAKAPALHFIPVAQQNPLTRQVVQAAQPVSGWPPVRADQWCGEWAGKLS